METLGGCFKEALENAQVSIPDDLHIPDWIQIEDIPAVCKVLDLEWCEPENIKLGVEPVIVLYRTGRHTDQTGHAVFMPDIGPLINRVSIVGLIRITNIEQKEM